MTDGATFEAVEAGGGDLHDNEKHLSQRAEKLRDTFGLLTPKDFAALIGVDERTLATWRARGHGPDFNKLGRAVFYHRNSVQTFIDANVVPANRTAWMDHS